jgi:hypothetical protein
LTKSERLWTGERGFANCGRPHVFNKLAQVLRMSVLNSYCLGVLTYLVTSLFSVIHGPFRGYINIDFVTCSCLLPLRTISGGARVSTQGGTRILLGRHSGVFRNQPTGDGKKFFPRGHKFFDDLFLLLPPMFAAVCNHSSLPLHPFFVLPARQHRHTY